jgi:RNA polymerase sigma-70 factor (sigma-E family)
MGTERATTDHGDAVGQFVAAHGQSLLRFAFLLTAGRAVEAEDLVQAVLTRLVERGLEGLENPLAYARRAVVNEHRSTARRRATEERHVARIADRDVVDDPVVSDRLALLDALRALNEKERAVVVLRYYVDLPDSEIGEAVGCSRATVRSLVRRALAKLRARLGETEGPSGGRPDPQQNRQQDRKQS